MFEGEKTTWFYYGLFIFGGALCGLFASLWLIFIADSSYVWKTLTPFAFGSAVFMIIGLYLMINGVKKPQQPPPES